MQDSHGRVGEGRKAPKRNFRLCPPNFPSHYVQFFEPEIGWVYQTHYSSAYGPSFVITGVCRWGNYAGDVIPELMARLENYEIEAHEESRSSPRKEIRKTIRSTGLRKALKSNHYR